MRFGGGYCGNRLTWKGRGWLELVTPPIIVVAQKEGHHAATINCQMRNNKQCCWAINPEPMPTHLLLVCLFFLPPSVGESSLSKVYFLPHTSRKDKTRWTNKQTVAAHSTKGLITTWKHDLRSHSHLAFFKPFFFEEKNNKRFNNFPIIFPGRISPPFLARKQGSWTCLIVSPPIWGDFGGGAHFLRSKRFSTGSCLCQLVSNACQIGNLKWKKFGYWSFTVLGIFCDYRVLEESGIDSASWMITNKQGGGCAEAWPLLPPPICPPPRLATQPGESLKSPPPKIGHPAWVFFFTLQVGHVGQILHPRARLSPQVGHLGVRSRQGGQSGGVFEMQFFNFFCMMLKLKCPYYMPYISYALIINTIPDGNISLFKCPHNKREEKCAVP